MKNYRTIDYLVDGNEMQKKSYEILKELEIMEYLATYSPLLTGTIPIEIDIEGSDLDIVCSVEEFDVFEEKISKKYRNLEGYKVTESKDNVVINFYYKKMEIEIYGQNNPSEDGNAYRHMLVEARLLELGGEEFRKEIVALKKQGIKTEPAFCRVLEVEGDPYLNMLDEEKVIAALERRIKNREG